MISAPVAIFEYCYFDAKNTSKIITRVADDTKQSDSEATGTWSSSSLSSLPGPFRAVVITLKRVLCMSQIELFELLSNVQTIDMLN